ncbi:MULTISPECIES: serine hydrolase domain-containing protein [unclassified Streptomyces]|uniref:serine hydrolase domain-containing protein n=1 Tax=unclassified Streptomyces TaxID=2593676 RepID=UPI0036E92E48
MTQHESVESLTGRRPLGRRSLLGLLGAPVAVGGAWAMFGTTADAVPRPAAGSGSSVPVELRPGGEFEQFLAQLAAEDTFSGTVLVVRGKRTVLARSYGMADKAKSVPNTADTIYCLASVTKLFTAVAVAQLVQQGKVAFEKTLGTYVDGFPSTVGDTVTVHHLLTHTSGMGDYHGIDGYFTAAAGWTTAEQVMAGTLDFIRKAPLSFQSGAGHQYSNSGYTVLGAIVAQVSGQSYYDYIRQHVFGPAGMGDSDFCTKAQWRSDRRIAHPYRKQPSGQRIDGVDQEQLFTGLPDGNAFSTAPDLVRFTRALLDGTLLDPAHIDLVVGAKMPAASLPAKPGLPAKTLFEAYGPGVTLRNGKWAVGHNGGSDGISTNVEWYPSTDWVAVKLSNYDPQDTMVVDDRIQGILTQ